MAKEWILNSTMNRFQLNFKRNVGATSEAIRMCSPKNIDEWRAYYYANVRSEAHIEELGRRLYIKISEVVQSELESITEQDCIDYMKQMVIERTYDGYTTEIQTIYGQLQKTLGVPISPAPDEWDRLFNVDFYIEVKGKYIGLQIKPVKTGMQIPEIFKEYDIQAETHKHFTEVWGGKVFYLFSQKSEKGKEIVNKDVIAEISSEIQYLNSI
ncbi:MAG: MjaI family restriction endonuclease [Bacteroidales bacterium]|nr:MjaI family restriction endonuclease [Bacteroidales bacterium]